MENTYPTFLELKEFIKKNPQTTICDIRDKYNQKGDIVISMIKPEKKKEYILAYGINSDFFRYLQTFIKEDYVKCELNNIVCLMDSTTYIGKGEFMPIVLSIVD